MLAFPQQLVELPGCLTLLLPLLVGLVRRRGVVREQHLLWRLLYLTGVVYVVQLLALSLDLQWGWMLLEVTLLVAHTWVLAMCFTPPPRRPNGGYLLAALAGLTIGILAVGISLVGGWQWALVGGRLGSAFVLMGFITAYFYALLQELKFPYLEREPLFWMGCGILLFGVGTVLLLTLGGAPQMGGIALQGYVPLDSILTGILHCFYAVALWVRPRP
ncbi:hypothetical protein QWY85_07420 [Neolewinella lacunae]|uniref:Uncharacterized protein n=1 Tax=Neolewinella lacunae TaxID=1517758 RepID=A0A923PIB7_9BACT|nr:hypothetical protein [Neolewinella lacunae]MBC6994607.1 hypothetical protein [Neolewinella lacunae]MDN3634479.1 hypothetical protein [Neolewinella lacunae]